MYVSANQAVKFENTWLIANVSLLLLQMHVTSVYKIGPYTAIPACAHCSMQPKETYS